MISVVSVKSLPRNWNQDSSFVYIGRPSIFGNPVELNKKCPVCGEYHCIGGATIECFTHYFYERLESDLDFQDRVSGLLSVHKTFGSLSLVCWCKPNPCHGDVIKGYLDKFK